jgi:26S proteasome regulatory subunit N13
LGWLHGLSSGIERRVPGNVRHGIWASVFHFFEKCGSSCVRLNHRLALTHHYPGSATDSSSQDPSAVVQNFLRSLQGGGQQSSGQQQQQQQAADKPFTTLPDLLTSATTIPFINNATPEQVDNLCTFLPPEIFLLAQESSSTTTTDTPMDPSGASTIAAQGAIEALSTDQKKDIIKRVFHSPQLQQSLGSLTVALRDGGLPMIGDALGLDVEHGGSIRGGTMPLGGGEAVEAFVNGVKRTVAKDQKK